MTKTEKEIQAFLEKETRRKRAYLWGSYYVFTPVVLSKIFGDGLQIIYFQSINQRPKYWIVRVDSKIEVDMDEIIDAIEQEFGIGSYPSINWDGGHWGIIKNFL